MMAVHQAEKERQEAGLAEDSKPVGPRVSQVSEESNRLGQIISLLTYLARVVMVSSPKFKETNPGSAKPYIQPVMIDGETGEWTGGRPTEAGRRSKYEKVLSIAQEAAKRYTAARGDT